MFRTLLSLVALALPGAALAASPDSGGDFGLGLGGGSFISGLSGKYNLSEKNALQGVLGVNRWGFGASLDYLFEQPSFAGDENVGVAWNFGFGASAGTFGTTTVANTPGNTVTVNAAYVGVNAVVGIEVILQPVPLDLVLEYRPGLVILPNVGVALSPITGHLRYWF